MSVGGGRPLLRAAAIWPAGIFQMFEAGADLNVTMRETSVCSMMSCSGPVPPRHSVRAASSGEPVLGQEISMPVIVSSVGFPKPATPTARRGMCRAAGTISVSGVTNTPI